MAAIKFEANFVSAVGQIADLMGVDGIERGGTSSSHGFLHCNHQANAVGETAHTPRIRVSVSFGSQL